MHYSDFSIPELEASIRQINNTEERIEHLSQMILEGNLFIMSMEQAIDTLTIEELAVRTNQPNIQIVLNNLLKEDNIIRNQIIKEKIYLLNDKICCEAKAYVRHAHYLLEHYLRTFEISVKLKSLKGVGITSEPQKIMWNASKEKLIFFFELLFKSKMTPNYKPEEILNHFVDNKLRIFSEKELQFENLVWIDSDCRFSILVNELAKGKYINDEDKFVNFSRHFMNKKGKRFRNLAQMRNYTDMTNKSGDLIREIIIKLKQ